MKINNINKLHEIVVIGGGAGGLELTIRLCKKLRFSKKISIILIDESLKHVWKPLYHEVSVGTLDSPQDEMSYLYLAYRYNFKFIIGSLQSLNRANKTVTVAPILDEKEIEVLPKRYIHYDTLVIAIGSISNHFNIPGAKEHCVYLDKLFQAERFHKKFFHHLVKIIQEKEDTTPELKIAIIGGGATGVELAAEMHYAISQAIFIRLNKTPVTASIKLYLIEASERILSNLPTALSDKIAKRLKRLGIILLTGQRVSNITPAGIEASANFFIPTDINVWTAGIKAENILSKLDGLEVNYLHQLCVEQTLQTTRDKDIFALGDCASCPQLKRNKFVPPRAQAAHQQASFLSRALLNHLNGKPLPIYYYQDYGSLISLSEYEVAGNLMGKWLGNYFIQGKIARFFYWLLYKQHQVTVLGVWKTCLISISNIFMRKTKSRLKLH